MFIAARFKRGKKWKQAKCPPTNEQINMWHIHTMKDYLATKRTEVMTRYNMDEPWQHYAK